MTNILERTSDESRAIVLRMGEELSKHGRRKRDRIESKVGDTWISLRSARKGRVFAEVRPLRTRVEVFILPHRRELRDPHGLARTAPPTRGWGWFHTTFDVRSAKDVGRAVGLLLQSYEVAGRPNGGTARPRAHRGQRV